MELSPAAFSRDGYLISQREAGGIYFGARPSGENGCGWIAAYNVLRATLHPVRWQTVREELSRRLLSRGERGLHLLVLLGYLKEQGCRLRLASSLTGGRILARSCRAGILMYGTGTSTHYVAFLPQGDGQLRFLNVRPGMEDVTLPLRDFYRDIVQFPLFLLIAVM